MAIGCAHDTIVAAVFRQIENVAVGELRSAVAASLSRLRAVAPDGHGETVVDNSGNPALDPANMVEIGDHAVADIADGGAPGGPALQVDMLMIWQGEFAPVGGACSRPSRCTFTR